MHGRSHLFKEDLMSGTYRKPYDESKVGDAMTPTGFTSRELYGMEQAEQARIATSEVWLIARECNPPGDSRPKLVQLGFTIVEVADDLFYEVLPPQGWTKSTDGYWTFVKDESGNDRFSQFYKGAFYDRRAFVNL